MKAYKCDICGAFTEGLPLGVLYDNDVRKRVDICPDCLEGVNAKLDEMNGKASDPESSTE